MSSKDLEIALSVSSSNIIHGVDLFNTKDKSLSSHFAGEELSEGAEGGAAEGVALESVRRIVSMVSANLEEEGEVEPADSQTVGFRSKKQTLSEGNQGETHSNEEEKKSCINESENDVAVSSQQKKWDREIYNEDYKDLAKSEQIDCDQYNSDFEDTQEINLEKDNSKEVEEEAMDDMVAEGINDVEGTPKASIKEAHTYPELSPEKLPNKECDAESMDQESEPNVISTHLCEVTFLCQPVRSSYKIQRLKVRILKTEKEKLQNEKEPESSNPVEKGRELTLNQEPSEKNAIPRDQSGSLAKFAKPKAALVTSFNAVDKLVEPKKETSEQRNPLQLNKEESKSSSVTSFRREQIRRKYDSEEDTEMKTEHNSRITPQSFAEFPTQVEPNVFFRRNKAIQRRTLKGLHQEVEPPEPLCLKAAQADRDSYKPNRYVRKAQRDLQGNMPRRCRCFACYVKHAGLPPINPSMASNARMAPSLKRRKKVTSMEPTARKQLQLARGRGEDGASRTEHVEVQSSSFGGKKCPGAGPLLTGARSALNKLEPIDEKARRLHNLQPDISLPQIERMQDKLRESITQLRAEDVKQSRTKPHLPLFSTEELYGGNNVDWGKSRLFQRIFNGDTDVWDVFAKKQVLSEQETEELLHAAHKNAYRENVEDTLFCLCEDLSIDYDVDINNTSTVSMGVKQ